MKKLLFFLLIATSGWAGTWSIGIAQRITCTGGVSPCAGTLSPLPSGGANTALIIFLGTDFGSTSAALTIASATYEVTNNFTLVAGSGCAAFVSGKAQTVDCAYLINPPTLGTGALSVTLSSGSVGGSYYVTAIEVKSTASTVYFDAAGSTNSSANTGGACPGTGGPLGPSLSIGGTNDSIVQNVFTGTAATSPYISNTGTGTYTISFSPGSANTQGTAYLLNTVNNVAPTWCVQTATTGKAMNAIAFRDTNPSGGSARRRAMVINQ